MVFIIEHEREKNIRCYSEKTLLTTIITMIIKKKERKRGEREKVIKGKN